MQYSNIIQNNDYQIGNFVSFDGKLALTLITWYNCIVVDNLVSQLITINIIIVYILVSKLITIDIIIVNNLVDL